MSGPPFRGRAGGSGSTGLALSITGEGLNHDCMGHQTPAISEVTGCKLGVLQTLFCTPPPDPYALTDELARISTCRTQTMG